MHGQGTSLRTYVLTRLGLAVVTVWILLTLVFLLMRVAPGDPISAALGGHVSQQELAKRRHEAGYDKPIPQQYVEYMGDALTATSAPPSPTTARSARSSPRTGPRPSSSPLQRSSLPLR